MRTPHVRLVLPALFMSIALAACGGGSEPAQPPPPEVSVVTLAPETVTAPTPPTSRPEHMIDNLGAATGKLPDEAGRQRMIEHIASLG